VKFLADESVDYPIVQSLRDQQYHVDYIAELSPGISDEQVLDQAEQNKAILITADKDFGDITFRLGRVSSGILLYRLSGLNNQEKAKMILKIIQNYSKDLFDSFTVITPDQIRINKIPHK
jgi:predicted nuclease of predicted toxin-antitoxin system